MSRKRRRRRRNGREEGTYDGKVMENGVTEDSVRRVHIVTVA